MQPEPLARLRTRRHAQPRHAVRSLHIDPRPERRLVDADGDDEMQIVAIATERRVGRDVHREIEIAREAAARSRIPLALHAHALAIRDARWNADPRCLRSRLMPGAGTPIALTGARFPRASARRAAAHEHHVPPHRPNAATALALRAGTGCGSRQARPGTHAASDPACDG